MGLKGAVRVGGTADFRAAVFTGVFGRGAGAGLEIGGFAAAWGGSFRGVAGLGVVPVSIKNRSRSTSRSSRDTLPFATKPNIDPTRITPQRAIPITTNSNGDPFSLAVLKIT